MVENNLNIRLAKEERSYADRLKQSAGNIYGKIKTTTNEAATVLKGYAELGVCGIPGVGTVHTIKRRKDAFKKLGEDWSWKEILSSEGGIKDVAGTTGLQAGGVGGAYASQFLPAPWNIVGLASSVIAYCAGTAGNLSMNDEGRRLESEIKQ